MGIQPIMWMMTAADGTVAHKVLLTLLLSITSLLTAQPSFATSAGEYRQQGLSYRDQGRYPEAIAALEKSVELDPENIAGRVTFGWTLHLAGQEEAATTVLLQALYRDWQAVPTLNALGIVYLVSGEPTFAILSHTWAAMLKPDNEIAYFNLSLTCNLLQQHDWAIATAARAASLEPGNPHPLVALAIAHWSKGNSKLAQQAYRQALALDRRYGDRAFLSHLETAAFAPVQIELAEQVRTASL